MFKPCLFVYLFMSRPPAESKSPSLEATFSLSLLNNDLVLSELEDEIFLASKLELFIETFADIAAAAALTAAAVELAKDKLRAQRTHSLKLLVKTYFCLGVRTNFYPI